MQTAAFIHSEEIEKYHYPPECPFMMQRAAMLRKLLMSIGLLSGPDKIERPPQALTRVEAEMFHDPAYLNAIQTAAGGQFEPAMLDMGLGTPDCPVFEGMYDCAMLASGGTLTGARLILSGETHVAFNPSGGFHHAANRRAAGFCYINDLVIACMHLAQAGKRVLYLDIDVHHGDGVQNAFYGRKDVMTISFHEDGKTLFPGTGAEDEIGSGDGRGYSVNVAFPPDTFDEPFLRAFREVGQPLIKAYNPDVIVLELGMDGLAGDPLAHLRLTNNAHADIVKWVHDLGKPILACGGGGYHPQNTVRGWALLWGVMCGVDTCEQGIGMGGVMLESTDWVGGLRDREIIPAGIHVAEIEEAVNRSVMAIKSKVFPIHGI